MTTILQLIFEFFKTGLFAVGGGLATLPFLYDIAEKTGWYTNQDILNLIAISESTPGAIGINMATYVGFLTEGVVGGILATLALIAPSLIIIIIISKVLDQFKSSPVVQGVFKGLRPASTGLIVAAGVSVAELAFLNLDVSSSSLTYAFTTRIAETFSCTDAFSSSYLGNAILKYFVARLMITKIIMARAKTAPKYTMDILALIRYAIIRAHIKLAGARIIIRSIIK